MFLTGQFIDRNPDLVRLMIEDGHEIANHTWSHPRLTTFVQNNQHQTHPEMNKEKLQQELKKTQKLFENTTGKKMVPFWRAPFGEHNLQIRRWAAELGYRQIGWTLGRGESLDTMDWVADSSVSYYLSSGEILARILDFGQDNENGANGGIILMHLDSKRENDHAFAILPTMIDSLRGRGYELVKISEMIQ